MKKYSLLLPSLIFAIAPAKAAIIAYDLVGVGGTGLLSSSERPAAVVGGTGGEIGAGITFDTDTNILTVNVGWGSGNGFTDLTSATTNMHIHGPVAGAVLADFINGTAGVPSGFGIAPTSTSASSGNATAITRTLTATQATQLAEGRFYVNVHTATNGGGEIRGNLVPVPEPTAFSLLGLLGIAFGSRRRR